MWWTHPQRPFLRLLQVNTNVVWQAIYRVLNSMKNAALSCRKRSSKTLPPPAGCHIIILVNSLLKRPFTEHESMKLLRVIYIQQSARHKECRDALLKLSLESPASASGQFDKFSNVYFLCITFYIFEHYQLWMMDIKAQSVFFAKTPKLCV